MKGNTVFRYIRTQTVWKGVGAGRENTERVLRERP